MIFCWVFIFNVKILSFNWYILHIILCIKSIILNIYIHKNAINVVLIAINVVFIAINVVLIAINVVLIAINVVLRATTWRDLSNVNSAYKGWFYWIWGIKSCWERWRRWWTRFYIIIRVIYIIVKFIDITINLCIVKEFSILLLNCKFLYRKLKLYCPPLPSKIKIIY